MKKENISFGEFKSWLNGLIRGKRGAIPDLEDWKEIKKMLDKVKENEPITITEKEYVPYQPVYIPSTPKQPWDPMFWCGTDTEMDVSNLLPITKNTYDYTEISNSSNISNSSDSSDIPINFNIKVW